MTSTTATIHVEEISATAVHLRIIKGGASKRQRVRWDDLAAAAGPDNDLDLRAVYHPAYEQAQIMRVNACPGHVPTKTVERPFVNAVASTFGTDGEAPKYNPSAHGGVCIVETCRCGATRHTNRNGQHEERGTWTFERQGMRDDQGYPVA